MRGELSNTSVLIAIVHFESSENVHVCLSFSYSVCVDGALRLVSLASQTGRRFLRACVYYMSVYITNDISENSQQRNRHAQTLQLRQTQTTLAFICLHK